MAHGKGTHLYVYATMIEDAVPNVEQWVPKFAIAQTIEDGPRASRTVAMTDTAMDAVMTAHALSELQKIPFLLLPTALYMVPSKEKERAEGLSVQSEVKYR